MTAARILEALALPESCRVDQRVPRKLLGEQAAATAAGRRLVRDQIESLLWVAALKPATIGVPAYRDDRREYLEIAVLHAVLRTGARATRLVELIHRAVPYPVLLVVEHADGTALSLAHKRRALNEAGRVVLEDGFPRTTPVTPDAPEAFFDALALHSRPRAHLLALYEGWNDVLIALETFRRTGRFHTAASAGDIALRHETLEGLIGLEERLARLRKRAVRERQVARQVELNQQIRDLERRRRAALDQLSQGERRP